MTLQQPAIKLKENILFALQFAMSCEYSMHMGLLALKRGHASDPMLYIRKSVEACAFAARIRQHPHLLTVWAEAINDKKSYDLYQKKFTTRLLGRLFYIFATHNLILVKFAEIFAEELGENTKVWAVRVAAIEAKIATHQFTWRPILEEELKQKRG